MQSRFVCCSLSWNDFHFDAAAAEGVRQASEEPREEVRVEEHVLRRAGIVDRAGHSAEAFIPGSASPHRSPKQEYSASYSTRRQEGESRRRITGPGRGHHTGPGSNADSTARIQAEDNGDRGGDLHVAI